MSSSSSNSNSSNGNSPPLTMALPKGRLTEQVLEHLQSCGFRFSISRRSLTVTDDTGRLKLILVKNSDLPVYVSHGIAGLGVCGTDVLYEAGSEFFELHTFEFGTTRMCLACLADHDPSSDRGELTVATKFTRFAHDFFHARGIPVQVIRLNGSVELAPVLGLAPYIVDLVETGSTLKANNLKVTEDLAEIRVKLVCNPAYYKVHHRRVADLLRQVAAPYPHDQITQTGDTTHDPRNG